MGLVCCCDHGAIGDGGCALCTTQLPDNLFVIITGVLAGADEALAPGVWRAFNVGGVLNPPHRVDKGAEGFGTNCGWLKTIEFQQGHVGEVVFAFQDLDDGVRMLVQLNALGVTGAEETAEFYLDFDGAETIPCETLVPATLPFVREVGNADLMDASAASVLVVRSP